MIQLQRFFKNDYEEFEAKHLLCAHALTNDLPLIPLIQTLPFF
jgi:hypothetical protein